MRLRSLLLLGLLLLVLPACQLFSGTSTPASPLVGTFVAATLTFYASGSTLPAPTQTPTLTLTPTETPDGNIPPQAAPIPQPAGEITILLMGSDQRPHAPDFRTDTALLVVLKTDGSVSLVSFPR